jgi:multiple sugar transport system substrate-binding protein
MEVFPQMKRFLSLLTAVLLVCSVMLPLAVASAEEPVTLSILWWGSQTRHDLTTKLVEKFMEKYPDIKLEMEFTDWDGYWSKLSAQVAGGLTPDIFQMDYAYLAQYAENGVLAPLDDFIASGALNVSDVSENVLASGKIGDKIYALSTGTNAPVMLYRKDLVEQAGVEIPLDPTLSEYIAVSKAVYEKTGMRDIHIVGGSADNLRFRLRSYGMNLYNDDASALGFDDPKYIVDMWNVILTAQKDGYGMIPGEETAATAFNSLVTDTWARYQNSNELQAYRDATGADIGMFAIPIRMTPPPPART